MSVQPPSIQWSRWCTSVNSVCEQPGKRQPLSRRLMAMRCASLGSRRVRPRLRLCPFGSSAERSTLASQASRRATSRESGPRTSSSAPPSPPAKYEGRRGRRPWAGSAASRRPVPHRGRPPPPPLPSPWTSFLHTATRASARRRSKGVLSRRRRLARAMSELFTTAYWSSGSTPVRLRRRSSKRRKRLANWPVAWASDWFRAALASSRTCLADQRVACSAKVASVSGLATSTRGLTWSNESFPLDSASEICGSWLSLAAAVTHSRAVAAVTPHRCTSQPTMEVAPSTRQARRRSSSTTAASS